MTHPTEEQCLKPAASIELKFDVRFYVNAVGSRLIIETESDVAFMDPTSARSLRDWLNQVLP